MASTWAFGPSGLPAFRSGRQHRISRHAAAPQFNCKVLQMSKHTVLPYKMYKLVLTLVHARTAHCRTEASQNLRTAYTTSNELA
eukprot:363514-Chlamydomonas_euryale.AAC.6